MYLAIKFCTVNRRHTTSETCAWKSAFIVQIPWGNLLPYLKHARSRCVWSQKFCAPLFYADNFCLIVFCVFVCWGRNVPQIGTIVNFLDESKRCLTFVKSVRHFGKCHENHVNRVRVFIGWQLPKHFFQSFTRQIRVSYQHEKVGKKVGENRGKFYLSPTVCQRVCRLHGVCAVRTHQFEFAHASLPALVCRVKAALAYLQL